MGGADAFARLINAMALPCVATDRAHSGKGPQILLINPAFEVLTGFRAAELCGHSLGVLYGPDTDIRARQNYDDEMHAAGKAFTHLIGYGKNGNAFEALIIGSRVCVAGPAGTTSDCLYVNHWVHIGDAHYCLPLPPRASQN